MFCSRAYDQILKIFSHIFSKKIVFYHVLKVQDKYCNRFMIIH
jgi:hypothetical protein